MKKVIFPLLLIAVIFLFLNKIQIVNDRTQTVNPILGDISFIHKFGNQPSLTTNEDLRIKTHLEYVENLLRHKNITDLPFTLQRKRAAIIDLLHEYWIAGVFPRNYDYHKSRKPCFIDKDNRICAVGYLVNKTAGRKIAEDINGKHKYETILEMNDKMVDNWIAASGLSKEECAMIQPTYGGTGSGVSTYSDNYITPAYGISSSVLSGLNLSFNTINSVNLLKGTNNKTMTIAGLITGAGQAILGASTFPKTTLDPYTNTIKESKKTLSMINIGLGTTTAILSTWNLITHRKPKDKKTICNLTSFETKNNKVGMAFTVTRKF